MRCGGWARCLAQGWWCGCARYVLCRTETPKRFANLMTVARRCGFSLDRNVGLPAPISDDGVGALASTGVRGRSSGLVPSVALSRGHQVFGDEPFGPVLRQGW